MGFGLCVLGYLLIIFDSFYAGVIGWPLLAWGFFKLGKVRKSFFASCALCAVCTLYSVCELLDLAKIITLDKTGELYFALHLAYILLGACIHLIYLLSVRDIALEGGDMKIAMNALAWLAFTEFYYALCIISAYLVKGGATGSEFAQIVGNVTIIMKYLIGFTNLWFLYGCYTKITTASQMEKDEETMRRIAEKEEQKRRKREKE
ncbi:MAG: hypothetical protein IJK33_03335 [Clostridia bacterium]|nr:hypothetical protein [Clostridia bacterium]MBQ6182899.1 hypothetical protein [Clostridia bacterium]